MTDQLVFPLEVLPVLGGVRRTDPQTSYIAARTDRTTTVERVLALYRSHSTLTAGECAELLPDAYSQTVRGIVSRLKHAGVLIVAGAHRESAPRNALQEPYRLADAGPIGRQAGSECSSDVSQRPHS